MNTITKNTVQPLWGKQNVPHVEKQRRGQDGAGFASIKFDIPPGYRYISRKRSNAAMPIQDIFSYINTEINQYFRNTRVQRGCTGTKITYAFYWGAFRTCKIWNIWQK